MTPQQIKQMRVNSCRKGLTMYGEYVAGAMDASEWQRKHDIEKACEWLNDNLWSFVDYDHLNGINIDYGQLNKQFCKAMEEEK